MTSGDFLDLSREHQAQVGPVVGCIAVRVMADLGGVLSRTESDRKLDRYIAAFEQFGYGRWGVWLRSESGGPTLLGYAGVMPVRSTHPLGDHDEIGWRFTDRRGAMVMRPRPPAPRSMMCSPGSASVRF